MSFLLSFPMLKTFTCAPLVTVECGQNSSCEAPGESGDDMPCSECINCCNFVYTLTPEIDFSTIFKEFSFARPLNSGAEIRYFSDIWNPPDVV